jgi:hypothetical protein
MTQALKRRLFAAGAEAIERISPYRGLYACPTCMRLLPIEAIDKGELTLEHVPPESMGGKGIALTCERCNSTAGHTVDAAVHGRERYFNLGRALSGKPGEYEGPVQIDIGGITANASMSLKDGKVRIEVHKRRNHPQKFRQQKESLGASGGKAPGSPPEIRVRARVKFEWHPSLVGDLRAAYLAAFAMFGYSWAFHPRLALVRKQIIESDKELIDGAWWIAGTELTEDPMLMVMTAPFPAVMVRLQAALVVLPWMGGPKEFYPAVRSLMSQQPVATYDLLDWPTKLELLFDLDGQPPTGVGGPTSP